MTATVPTIATRAQVAKWEQARERASKIGDLIWCAKQLAINASIAYTFGQSRGIAVQSPAALEAELIDLEQRYSRIKQAMDRVDARTWGVHFRADDIDIIEPPAEMGGVILVIAGVVAVAALGAALYAMWQEARESNRKFNALLGATDQALCTSPDTCAEWQQVKADMGYEQRQGVVDDALDSIGQAATTGTKWGLALAIPIALIALLWDRK